MSIETLSRRIAQLKNPSVAGLDPRMEFIPENITSKASSKAEAVYLFNTELIDALCDIVPAVKPQSAYYELLGPEGAYTLKKTMDYARKKGMYVILDAKRGDIGATAEAYAQAYLSNGEYNADSLTVNGYLGSDGIAPFIKQCAENEKSIFVLAKTSNKSSGELQDRVVDGKDTVYATMAAYAEKWGAELVRPCGYSEVCAVVGATYPDQIRELRGRFRSLFFLVPGYGAQGGGARDVAPAFDENGGGAIVNSSRAIMCAWQKNGGSVGDAARREAIRMRDEITSALR